MCASTRSASSRRTRAASWSRFLESFFQNYVEYDFTAVAGRAARPRLQQRARLAAAAARFLGRLHRRGRRDQGPAHHAGARRAQRAARRRTSSRRARTAAIRGNARPAATASCRSSSAASAPSSAARTIRNATTPASSTPGANGADTGDARCSARIRRPVSTSRCAAAASVPMSSSAKATRKPRKSRNAPACRKALLPDDVDLEKALGLLSLPRDVGKHPESGETDHRRHRPLRPLCAARQDLRQSRSTATRCSLSASIARSR